MQKRLDDHKADFKADLKKKIDSQTEIFNKLEQSLKEKIEKRLLVSNITWTRKLSLWSHVWRQLKAG